MGSNKRFGGLYSIYYALFKGKAKGRKRKESSWNHGRNKHRKMEGGGIKEAHYI